MTSYCNLLEAIATEWAKVPQDFILGKSYPAEFTLDGKPMRCSMFKRRRSGRVHFSYFWHNANGDRTKMVTYRAGAKYAELVYQTTNYHETMESWQDLITRFDRLFTSKEVDRA